MIMKKLLILIFFLPFLNELNAQKSLLEHYLKVPNDKRQWGWTVGVGPTYSFPVPKEEQRQDVISDSGFQGMYTSSGSMGLNVEAGGFKIFRRGFLHFMDYGAHFQRFSGESVFEGSIIDPQVPVPTVLLNGVGEYSQNLVGGYFGVNRIAPINEYFFLVNNFNVDVNYRLSESSNYSYSGGESVYENNNSNIQSQLSYKLGIGYRTRTGWLMLTGNLPLVSSYNTDDFITRKDIINGDFSQVSFALKYMWLANQPGLNCPDHKKNKRKEKLFNRKMY